MSRVASPRSIAWVGKNILPHERDVRTWLRNSFPNLDVDDTVQETYCRIAALAEVEHIRDPRNYFFRSARNVVIDQIRRSRIISIEAASGLSEFLAIEDPEAFSPENVIADRRMLSRVEELIAHLPTRTRDIFRMRKVEGLSQRDVARALGVTETVVENEVARGLRKILDRMTIDERDALPLRRTMRIRGREQRSRD